MKLKILAWLLLMAVALPVSLRSQERGAMNDRPRAREIGLRVGILPPGPLNAITDVPGVLVGQTTVIRGDAVRTGITAILPHGENLFREKVPAAIHVGNGFGKLMGSTQVNELGEIETPILLTNTLNVAKVADGLIDWMLALPGNEDVRSVNPVVGETNDGYLNDIRGRHLGREEVFSAIRGAVAGPVAEGSVGAGTGTVAFGFKGGIGTSSRRLPAALGSPGGFTVGVLVQSNYGGVLTIGGAPVGQELGQYYLREVVESGRISHDQRMASREDPNGSIMIVVATDVPLDHRQLRRLAERAMSGLARTGSSGSNGSGDYVIAFSTARENRIRSSEQVRSVRLLGNEPLSPLFQSVIEATEEAVYNSLFRATSVTGRSGNRAEALPLDRTIEILRARKVLSP
jgi:D-aminopeptidase